MNLKITAKYFLGKISVLNQTTNMFFIFPGFRNYFFGITRKLKKLFQTMAMKYKVSSGVWIWIVLFPNIARPSY